MRAKDKKNSTATEALCAATTTAALQKYRLARPMCGACPSFGKRWACPPFDAQNAPNFETRKYANLAAVKIKPSNPQLAPKEIIDQARETIDEIFYGIEKLLPNATLALAGSCLCPHADKCPRTRGAPCARPDKMRASLEAANYDVVKIAKDILQTDILWQTAGKQPPYFTLAYCVFADIEAPEKIAAALAENLEGCNAKILGGQQRPQ